MGSEGQVLPPQDDGSRAGQGREDSGPSAPGMSRLIRSRWPVRRRGKGRRRSPECSSRGLARQVQGMPQRRQQALVKIQGKGHEAMAYLPALPRSVAPKISSSPSHALGIPLVP